MSVVAVVMALTALGRAADADRAAELFENGAVLYDEGGYDAAILAFREALALSGRSELHFNIANCLERMNRLEEAYNELNLYRAVAPTEERVTLDRRLQSIRARIESQRLAAPAPVPVPVPVPVPIPAARPTVRATPVSWALLAVGGAVGAASLVGLGVSYGTDPDDRGAALPLSWVGLAGGAGIGLTGVLLGEASVGDPPGVAVRIGWPRSDTGTSSPTSRRQ